MRNELEQNSPPGIQHRFQWNLIRWKFTCVCISNGNAVKMFVIREAIIVCFHLLRVVQYRIAMIMMMTMMKEEYTTTNNR